MEIIKKVYKEIVKCIEELEGIFTIWIYDLEKEETSFIYILVPLISHIN